MKNLLLSLMLFAVLVTASPAALTFLPESETFGYSGTSQIDPIVNNGVTGYMDFAVYDTDTQTVSELETLDGYNGEQYIYAYQIFPQSGSMIDSFKLMGFNQNAFTSDKMGTTNSLDGYSTSGVDAEGWSLIGDNAVWYFESGVFAAGENSYFLVIFSDYAPKQGTFEVNPTDDDPLVPGEDGNDDTIPEPATLGLLLGGALLTVISRRNRR